MVLALKISNVFVSKPLRMTRRIQKCPFLLSFWWSKYSHPSQYDNLQFPAKMSPWGSQERKKEASGGSLPTSWQHSSFFSHQCTTVQTNQESRLKYWATRSSVCSFARTAHSFACSGLLASLAPSAALTRSLARSLHSLPRSWESELLDGSLSVFF